MSGSSLVTTQATIEPKASAGESQPPKTKEQHPAEEPRDLGKTTEGVYDELPMSAGLSAPYAHTGGDPFYAHHSALPGSSLLNYVRPRYHDESYRRHDDRPLSPTRPSVSVLNTLLSILVY
ncbi:hypothetical protein ANCCAN_17289 [Ancylostoma caninum]|uniref:Uncharacterized protein n=1 Tax=Ancylostoma caninum TaxID=29170 RepID=A0A368G2K9_ANCCA|nr:hypothetical protein ANCCAN_17289 [Ancylostoma caninum]